MMYNYTVREHPETTALGVNLTRREIVTMCSLADGLTSAQIAKKPGVTKCTVDGYISSAQLKFNAGNRLQALSRVSSSGLIPPTKDYRQALDAVVWAPPEDSLCSVGT